jgi:hypothetical protein
MAVNERVENEFKDVGVAQLAPSQEERTSFTPGVANSNPLDMNWTKDYRIPTGTPVFDENSNGPVDMTRNRVFLVGRNSMCDQTLSNVPADPLHTTQVNNGVKERRSGYDMAEKS